MSAAAYSDATPSIDWPFLQATGMPAEPANALFHVLLALAVVIVTARLLGAFFARLHQPPVIGEVIGGIMLGPSFLGAVSPAAYSRLLPPDAAPVIEVIAQLGIVLYMFTVGLHLDLQALRSKGRAAVLISQGSIIVPFGLGVVLAQRLHPDLAGENVGFTAFALFVGISMSITAFPVLARILSDKGLDRTDLGTLALTCAAVDDVTAWCLLAFVANLSQATMAGAFTPLGLTVVYTAVMLLAARPLVVAGLPWIDKAEPLSGLALMVVTLLLSALTTEFIGLHALFGAFLLGAIVPPTSRLAVDATSRIEGLVRVMFLPAFFAFAGMHTEIGLLATSTDWMLCLAIVAAATLGKIGGACGAGLLAGLGRADSVAIGILMNTRGLVELIVLHVGLDLGVISVRLYTMLVIMAIVTTVMTTPLLDRVMRGRVPALEPVSRR